MPVDPRGVVGPTRGQARGPGWRRTSRGLFVPATTAADLPEQRVLEQSMRLPTVGAVTGWAGCRVHGAAFFDGFAPDGVTPLPVPLAVGPGGSIRAGDGVVLTFDRLPASDVVRRQGMPVVSAVRAVFDAARLADDVREAVVAIDMAIAGRITSVQRVTAYTREHHDQGITGIGQVREAMALARERSWSPNESRLRLIGEIDAGLPPLVPNCPILDRSGALLGIADLLDPEAGLAIEFDGANHRGRARHTRDVAKDEAFRAVGLGVTRVTGTDLRHRDRVVHRLLSARGRALFEAPDVRRWVAVVVEDSAESDLREQEAWADLHAAEERAAAEHPEPAFRA